MIRALGVILLCLTVLGCSVRYGPRIPGFQPGYEEERLGQDTFQVRIGEAWPKDWPDLEKFALYRAADVTVTSGKQYFAVLNSSSHITSYAAKTPMTTYTTGSATVSGTTVYGNSVSRSYGGQSYNIQGGWYTLDFKILSATDTKGYKTVIEANKVIEDLKYFIEKRK